MQHISVELSRSHQKFLLIASESGFSLRVPSSISIVMTPKKALPRQMMLDGILIYLDRVPIVPKSSIVNISCSFDLFVSSIPLMTVLPGYFPAIVKNSDGM